MSDGHHCRHAGLKSQRVHVLFASRLTVIKTIRRRCDVFVFLAPYTKVTSYLLTYLP